jgi:uncharacterized protein (DUF2147 family)
VESIWRRALAKRSTRICLVTAGAALAVAAAAAAADLKDMVGRWRWQNFTIEVSACKGDSICAKVTAGPKNVGLDLFASKLVSKNGDWFGQITHPETREIYDTRFRQKDKDRWQLDGCTAVRVCLTGEFVRVN